MLFLVDNYDSFTYNLVQYLGELGQQVEVARNNQVELEQISHADALVLSPGPCTPAEAGISVEAVQHFAGKMPILGVCLGHQSIAVALGGKLREVPPMHGKISQIHHRQQGLFDALPNPMTATRYHSLVVDPASLPETLEVDAWTADDNGEREHIMGVCHRQLPIWGVQFHPESILTLSGKALLRNFLHSAGLV